MSSNVFENLSPAQRCIHRPTRPRWRRDFWMHQDSACRQDYFPVKDYGKSDAESHRSSWLGQSQDAGLPAQFYTGTIAPTSLLRKLSTWQ